VSLFAFSFMLPPSSPLIDVVGKFNFELTNDINKRMERVFLYIVMIDFKCEFNSLNGQLEQYDNHWK
jgi:hypothetical protein